MSSRALFFKSKLSPTAAGKSLVIGLCLLTFKSHSQKSLSELLNTYNTNKIPYITAQQLAMPKTKAIILDAREIREYEVSHIKGAIHVGFKQFNLKKTRQHLGDTKQSIVVYCSLGVRSETIAEQLKKAGFHSVKNLFGGIFEWKNNNFPIYDIQEKETDRVHAFSKEWSEWLKKGVKVYD